MLREALWSAALLRRFSDLTTDDTNENNDEIRMTKLEGMTDDETRRNDNPEMQPRRKLLRHLVIVSSFVIRASSFSFVSIGVHSWLNLRG
jgi:hypothetical protein